MNAAKGESLRGTGWRLGDRANFSQGNIVRALKRNPAEQGQLPCLDLAAIAVASTTPVVISTAVPLSA